MFEPTSGMSQQEYVMIVLLNAFILIIGATLDFLGILLWMRKIQPNRCIGVKIQSMGDNKDVWFEVNEYAGKVITIEGLFLVIFSLLFMILPYSFSLLGRVLVFLAVFLLSMGGVVFLAVNRAKAFARPGIGSSFEL